LTGIARLAEDRKTDGGQDSMIEAAGGREMPV
jgi:hypothetical protein